MLDRQVHRNATACIPVVAILINLSMDKITALLPFLLLTHFSFGQSPSFFADGSRWVYHTGETSEPGQQLVHSSDRQDILHGDTLIGGINYFKLYSTFHHQLLVYTFPEQTLYSYDSIGPAYIRYDTTLKMVYYLPHIDSTERLIYDFNLQVGDTVPLQAWENLPVTIDSIDTIQVFGMSAKRFFLDIEIATLPPENYIIEGLGGSNGLTFLQPTFAALSGGIDMTSLTCFEYQDSLYAPTNSDCPFIDFVSALQPVRDNPTLLIRPNPTPDVFTVTISEDLLHATFTIVDALGRVIQSFKLSDLHTTAQLHSPGLYFWRVEQSGRLMGAGKLVGE